MSLRADSEQRNLWAFVPSHSKAGKSGGCRLLAPKLPLQLTETPALDVLLSENTRQRLAKGNPGDVSLQYKCFPWWEQLKKLDSTGDKSPGIPTDTGAIKPQAEESKFWLTYGILKHE